LSRYRDSVCRQCRREAMKLFLKGERCFSDKCAYERRPYPPGQHGQGRIKFSDYGLQLREKQKIKRIYGLSEKQFRLFYSRAERQRGITGENLLISLERRLDNMVYRMGFTSSRRQAREWVGHSHFTVNGRKANIPSMLIGVGDVIEVKEGKRNNPHLIEAVETSSRRGVPAWVELDRQNWRGVVKALPTREELTLPMQEQLIVEFYSK
jgi:small subunit ribosomal protein S4